MLDSVQLVSFAAVATLLVVAPGPNTVLILTNAIGGGRSAGLATVIGLETGTLVHSIAAGLGISRLLATSPAAFAAVQYLGAAYLTFLGLRALTGRGHQAWQHPHATRVRWGRTFERALIASVLNPKAAVFFLAFLPQFVNRSVGHVWLQFMVLGGIVAIIGLAVGGTLTLAVTGGAVRQWLRSDTVAKWQERVAGTVLLGLGVRLLLAGRT